MLTAKQPRPKKCRCCKIQYIPSMPMQIVCTPACALKLARAKSERERKAIDQRQRREIKTAKDRLKSRADHLRETQKLFNEWVRLRDAHLGCVSCDKPATWHGQWHASHFLSVGSSPEHRFNPHNVHKACSICNNHLSGNILGFRPELERRIGLEAVEALLGPCEAQRYTIDELKAMKTELRAKIKELKGRAA